MPTPMGRFPVYVPDTKGAFAIPTPPEYPKLHTLCLAVAKRGAGKSTAVCSLIRDLLQARLLDRVFVMSPTCGSNQALYATVRVAPDDSYDQPGDKALQAVVKKVEEEAAEWREYVRKKEKWDRLQRLLRDPRVDLDAIPPELMEGLDNFDQPPQSKYGHAPRLALLVDDCQGTKLFSTGCNNSFGHLCIKHRHVGEGLGMSVFILCQNFASPGACNRFIRQNATHLMLFRERDAEVMEKIAAEASGVHWSREDFLRAHRYAVSQGQHDFLFVEYNPPRLRRCFDEVLTDPSGRLQDGLETPTDGGSERHAQGPAEVGGRGGRRPVPARQGLLHRGHEAGPAAPKAGSAAPHHH